MSLSYQADRIHEALDIPQITPPSPFDDFEEVVVKQPYWQASLGMQYALSSKRLKPYLGVSILGQSKSHERFEYHFTNRLTKQDQSVQLSRHDGDFEIRYMRFHAGAEYPVLKRFKTLLESSYDLNLGHAPQYKPLWNVKMGILYRL